MEVTEHSQGHKRGLSSQSEQDGRLASQECREHEVEVKRRRICVISNKDVHSDTEAHLISSNHNAKELNKKIVLEKRSESNFIHIGKNSEEDEEEAKRKVEIELEILRGNSTDSNEETPTTEDAPRTSPQREHSRGVVRCDVRVRKLTRWEVQHGRARVERKVRREEVEKVLSRMYRDREGHLWSRVPGSTGEGVDEEASVMVDLIEQHVRDCLACRRNPAFACAGEVSSRHQLQEQVRHLEEKVDQLTAKLGRLEGEVSQESLLEEVARPRLLSRPEYLAASGLRLVDMAVVRQALASAQQCGHASLSLAEVSPLRCQEDLATQLALLCLTCGAQTVFCSSAFSTAAPANFSANKRLLPKLGAAAYYALSSALRSDGRGDRVAIPGGHKARLLLRLDRRGEEPFRLAGTRASASGEVQPQEKEARGAERGRTNHERTFLKAREGTRLPQISDCRTLPPGQAEPRLSNDMVDYVRVRCALCANDYPMFRLRNHTRYSHNLSIRSYKAMYSTELVEVVHHRCGLCGDTLLNCHDAIKNHLKRPNHSLSIKEYQRSYMRDSRMEREVEEGVEEDGGEEDYHGDVEDLDGIVIPLPGEGYADIAEDETAAVEECKAEAVECAPDIAGEQEGGADEEQIEVIARMKLEEIKKVRAEAKEKQRCVEVINLDDPDASLSKTDTVQAKENLECDEKHQEVHFDQDHLVDKEVEEVTSSLEKQNSLENIANEKTFISIEPDTNNKNGDGGDKESDLTKLYDDQELVNNDTVDREKKELEKDKKVEVEDGVEGGGGGPREATPLRLVSLATLVPSSPPHQGGGASLPGWTTAEGSPPPRPPTPPLTAADVVANTPIPQGTVTPVAPGTKLVSSSVLRMSSAMVGRFTSVRRVLTSGCSPAPPRRGCPPVCTCWCAPPAPRPCS